MASGHVNHARADIRLAGSIGYEFAFVDWAYGGQRHCTDSYQPLYLRP